MGPELTNLLVRRILLVLTVLTTAVTALSVGWVTTATHCGDATSCPAVASIDLSADVTALSADVTGLSADATSSGNQ